MRNLPQIDTNELDQIIVDQNIGVEKSYGGAVDIDNQDGLQKAALHFYVISISDREGREVGAGRDRRIQ